VSLNNAVKEIHLTPLGHWNEPLLHVQWPFQWDYTTFKPPFSWKSNKR